MRRSLAQIDAELAAIPRALPMHLSPAEMLGLFDRFPINAIGYSPMVGPMTVRREDEDRAANLRGDETHVELISNGDIWIVPFENLTYFYPAN